MVDAIDKAYQIVSEVLQLSGKLKEQLEKDIIWGREI
jgi:hypothetical protein